MQPVFGTEIARTARIPFRSQHSQHWPPARGHAGDMTDGGPTEDYSNVRLQPWLTTDGERHNAGSLISAIGGCMDDPLFAHLVDKRSTISFIEASPQESLTSQDQLSAYTERGAGSSRAGVLFSCQTEVTLEHVQDSHVEVSSRLL